MAVPSLKSAQPDTGGQRIYRKPLDNACNTLDSGCFECQHGIITLPEFHAVSDGHGRVKGWCAHVECGEVLPILVEGIVIEFGELLCGSPNQLPWISQVLL